MTKRISSPQPSVVHLVTLFRQISGGEIRVPAFQRNYVWTEKQVLSLLSSVMESFPIGSLLFWRVDSQILKVAPQSQTAFPELDESYPLSYVLDGMQRLTTLYGVFNFDPSSMDQKLNVGYHLRNKTFIHLRGSAESVVLPLSSLFSPRKLLDFQAVLSVENDADVLLDEIIEVQSAFQEYMIPTVTIQSPDVDRVVGVFERVNSTGTRLNSVDFMRAITWSNTFDLSRKLADVSSALSEQNWTVSEDTLVKMAAMNMNMNVSSESLLALRDADENNLHEAFASLPSMMLKTADFLRTDFDIYSPDVVSYEGQLLSAFLVANSGELEVLRNVFRKWFWACGLNEQLRGKPDDYIVRLLRDWEDATINGDFQTTLTPSFSVRDFLNRRLMGGAAFTNTYKMMLAKSKARDLTNGEVVDAREYLSGISTSQFLPILGKSELLVALEEDIFSAKLYSNCILSSFEDLHSPSEGRLRVTDCIERGDLRALSSQFIDEIAAELLIAGDNASFLKRRAELMHGFAVGLIT